MTRFARLAKLAASFASLLQPHDQLMASEQINKPIPYMSLGGAIGFALSLMVLVALETAHAPGASVEAQKARVWNVMICVLIAAWSSIVSLITAWCPIILGGDRRPWLWVIPLLLGWVLFLQWFDWRSLLPQ